MRLHIGQRCLGGAERVRLGHGVDLRDQIALPDFIAEGDMQGCDLTGGLGTDRHQGGWLQDAVGEHGLLDAADRRRPRHIGDFLGRRETCPAVITATCNQDQHDEAGSGVCDLVHTVPATAECFVERYVAGGDGHLALKKGILRRIERAFRIEHVEEAA